MCWFIYRALLRKLDRADIPAAMAMHKKKKEKEMVTKLIQVMESIRDEMYALYWDVHLGE